MKKALILGATVAATVAGIAAIRPPHAPPPAASVRTIAEFPNISPTSVSAFPGGRLLFILTESNELLAYDRSKKSVDTIYRGEILDMVASPTGNMLGLLRPVEGTHLGRNQQTQVWVLPVDPQTGKVSGEMRRVSQTIVRQLRISPNGKDVAFMAGDSEVSLIVAPITGGRERTIVKGNIFGPIRWSPDGQWLYVAETGRQHTYISRIAVTGGSLMQMTPSVQGASPGLAPDGKHIVALNGSLFGKTIYSVFDLNKQSTDVMVAWPSGAEPIDHAWMFDGLHEVWTLGTARTSLFHAPLAGGPGVSVPLPLSGAVAESPDGKSIFFLRQGSGIYEQVVARVDGSGERVLGETSDMIRPFTVNEPWSTDGRYLAFVATDGLKVFEPATGKVTRVATRGTQQEFHWLPNSATLNYIQVDTAGGPRYSVRQTTIGGPDRLLRDFTANVPTPARFALVGDSLLFLRQSAALLPIYGGEPRELFHETPPAKSLAPTGPIGAPFLATISRDGKWIVRRRADGKSVFVVSADSSTKRLLPVGATMSLTLPPIFHPDGKSLIVPLDIPPTGGPAFFILPLDGSAPRPFLQLPAKSKLLTYSLSPDGRTVWYSTIGAPSCLLLDVDYGSTKP